MFIYLCLLQNLSRVCCAAPRPPTMPGSGQAIIIIRPPDTPWPPPPLSPTWTRTPGPWTGSWGSRGTGAGWASAGARTAVTASVSTCGTTWCTCNKRDRVTRDRCDVTRTSARGKCQTQSHSLGSIIFTQKCDCDTRAGSHLSSQSQFSIWAVNQWEWGVWTTPWHRDKMRRTEELTLAASFESPGLSLVMNYAAKMCRVSFMREAPAQLRVSVPLCPGYYLLSIWHLTGSLWFLLILTDVNRGEQSNKSPAVGCGKFKESRRNSLERRGCCDVQSRHPWSSKAGYFSLFPFPFYVGPAMKINMSRIAGEWRIGLRHLAPLKARVPLDLSHAALRFTFRGLNSRIFIKCREWSH